MNLLTIIILAVLAVPPRPEPMPKRLDDLTAKVEAQQRTIADLTKRLEMLEAKLDATEKALAAASADPKAAPKLSREVEIQKAIQERRLAVGMTLEQANAAMRSEGKLTGEDQEGKTYEWRIDGKMEIPGPRGLTSGRFATGTGSGRPTVRTYTKGWIVGVFERGKLSQFEVREME